MWRLLGECRAQTGRTMEWKRAGNLNLKKRSRDSLSDWKNLLSNYLASELGMGVGSLLEAEHIVGPDQIKFQGE